jgi:hypothetical protein
MPASEDDDVIDWGYLECEPSSSTFCGHQCDPFEPGFCPQHVRRGLLWRMFAVEKGFVPTLEPGGEIKETQTVPHTSTFLQTRLSVWPSNLCRLTHATPTALSMALLMDVRTSDALALRVSTILMDG